MATIQAQNVLGYSNLVSTKERHFYNVLQIWKILIFRIRPLNSPVDVINLAVVDLGFSVGEVPPT